LGYGGTVPVARRSIFNKVCYVASSHVSRNQLHYHETTMNDPYTITLGFPDIEMLKTPKGGYKRKTLEYIGVSWPPKKGWPARTVGNRVNLSAYEAALHDAEILAGKKNQQPEPRHPEAPRSRGEMLTVIQRCQAGDIDALGLLRIFEHETDKAISAVLADS